MFELPTTMQAIQQDEANGRLFLRDVPVPQPGDGEVLIRMAASPINPSDLGALSGLSYSGERSYPFIPGLEGSGTVVATGSGMMTKMLAGKRVSCLSAFGSYGTWAEYMLTSSQLCIPLRKGVSLEHGATLVVNPLTALAMIEIAKKGRHQAIVNTVAASNLGGMILKLARHQDIPVINIVRHPEQVQVVKERGGEYVINSSVEDFVSQLREMVSKLNATLFLDAVGGDMTQQLVDAAPNGSTLLLYSKMAEQNSCIDPFQVLVKDICLHGWFLANWLQTKNLLQTIALFRKAQGLLETDLASPIGQRVPLSSAHEALEKYVSSMTSHKPLIEINRVLE